MPFRIQCQAQSPEEPFLFGICAPPPPQRTKGAPFFFWRSCPPLTPRPPQIAHPHQRTRSRSGTGNRSRRATDPLGQVPRIHAQQNARETASTQTPKATASKAGNWGKRKTRPEHAPPPARAKPRPTRRPAKTRAKSGQLGQLPTCPLEATATAPHRRFFLKFFFFTKVATNSKKELK